MNRFLTFILIACSLLCHAETFFRPGMKWTEEIIGTATPFEEWQTHVYLVDLIDSDNPESLGLFLYQGSQQKLVAQLKINEQSVLFKLANASSDNWYTLYDFALQENQGTEVSHPYAQNYRSSYLKCVGIGNHPEYPGLEIMSMEEYSDSTCNTFYGYGEWIRGIGSTMGVLFNNGFGADGVASNLIEASMNGETLYRSKPLSITEQKHDNDITVRLDHQTCYISSSLDGPATIYSVDGMIVSHVFLVKEATTTLSLPTCGFYLLTAGHKTVKLFSY